MRQTVIRWSKRAAIALVIALVSVLGVRAWDSLSGPPLEPWHTFVPTELAVDEIGRTDWKGYLAAEQGAFDEVRREVFGKLAPRARVASNRYFDGSPLDPARFPTDWNRSFVLEPVGAPAGAVVLLHGLTDSPYSMRGVARRYRDRGYVAVVIRLPGHGTVPAGLTGVDWQAWSQATRLAVREARRRAPAPAPLHVVGYSNGGALAMKYALDAIEDRSLPHPDRLVLISPMIGVTSMARFAGIVGWPALFPSFARAAWLGIVPEFNPFKYNSFPVNAARQSSLVARGLQDQISEHARDGKLSQLPPILTFQSVVDFTVSTQAVVSALYDHLPANGSELVLFDLNRHAVFGPFLREAAEGKLDRLLPAAPRAWRASIVTNAAPDALDVVERVVEAGSRDERTRALPLAYPRDVFSLSHIALPFPIDDPLYGLTPDPAESFGVRLGALAPRGERGTLIVGNDLLTRMSSNPFFAYLLARVDEGIAQAQQRP
ncbi:MAG: alpha/beta fold hydrolase [Burkholderiales bacterium]|nr:alpha/beta fold hydrolase [Burkholderiales bacterium]